MAGRVALFLFHADPAALREAGACAASAGTLGGPVDVYLFGAAVAAVIEAHGDPEHPAALLHEARAQGCRLVGCSAGVVEARKAGVGEADAEAALDAVVGWPTVHAWSTGVVDRFFF